MEATHRKKCFAEKKRECHGCGDDGSELVVHHADGDATNDAIENLVPLCNSCHRKVHNGRRDDERLRSLCSRLEESTSSVEDAVDPREYPGVPLRATTTVKETMPGYKYYYWQWREGGSIKCEYIGPVDEFPTVSVSAGDTEQAQLGAWSD